MPEFITFIAILSVLMLFETRLPQRARSLRRLERWGSAALLIAIGTGLSRLIVPVGLIGLASWANSTGFGLLNRVQAPLWLEMAIAVVFLDLAVWFQHVMMHRIDWLWRFHRVHHSDPDFDVMTALRFHPGEIILSLLWKGAVVVALGASPTSVMVFAVLLNAGAMFNHSNLALPTGIDHWLRWLIVTPDMHRVHHSTDHTEANRNFGFFIPWWDRLFRLYKAQPDAGHRAMEIGQTDWRSARDQGIVALLKQPFERGA